MKNNILNFMLFHNLNFDDVVKHVDVPYAKVYHAVKYKKFIPDELKLKLYNYFKTLDDNIDFIKFFFEEKPLYAFNLTHALQVAQLQELKFKRRFCHNKQTSYYLQYKNKAYLSAAKAHEVFEVIKELGYEGSFKSLLIEVADDAN